MRTKHWIPLIALGLLLASACVPSLFPLYTDADLVTDARLAGAWKAADEDDLVWTFVPAGNFYRLAVFDDGTCAQFEARLVALDDSLFLDLLPEKPGFASGMYADHFLRVHTFYRIEISDDRFEVSALDLDELEQRVDEGTLEARLLEVDDTTVLAEPTPQLQKLVVELAATPGAFSEPDVMLRQ